MPKNLKNPRKKKPIKFPSIFNDKTSNQQIFDKILASKISNCFNGTSFTLLTYGISGSGKTFTIFGNDSNPQKFCKEKKSQGIIFYTIDRIFDTKETIELGLDQIEDDLFETEQIGKEKEEFNIDITASFIEIYNENVYDLLAWDKEKNTKESYSPQSQFERKLTIIESPFTNGVIVPDLKTIKVDDPQKLKELVTAVQNRRIVSPNLNNNYSSR